jgi:sn-glycerol 3-phosphate transport system ATP-binding protein
MATLELSGIGKSFGTTEVLRQIDLSLADGELLAIVGASGCGKSTLLRIVAGLETPSAGRVVLGGQDITDRDPADRDIAMVFQNYALYPHMSVAENMAYSLKIRRLSRAEIARRVADTAALLGLEELLARKPRQLSGGQRQRVAMGRAIIREPRLFLFDEPLSNLDAKLRSQMRAEIRRLQRRLGITSLFVTHDQVEAMTLGDRLLVLHNGHPGQLATPMEIFERPADTYVGSFIGMPAMNFLSATMAEDGAAARLDAGPLLRFTDGRRVGPPGRRLSIGIRPEHVVLDAAGTPLVIELIEPMGSEMVVHGHLAAPGEPPLVVKLAARSGLGERVEVSPEVARIHVFDRETGLRIEPIGAESVGTWLEAAHGAD